MGLTEVQGFSAVRDVLNVYLYLMLRSWYTVNRAL